MSAQGGGARQNIEEFSKALRDTLDDLRSLALGAGRAGRGLAEFTGATFAANTAMLASQRFVRDVAFGTGEDVLRGFGAQSSVSANALRAAAALPMDPFQAGELQRPIEAAGNRLGGITGPIARAGGKVTDEARQSIFELLHGEESRAEADAKANARLQNDQASRLIDQRGGGAGSFMGLPSNPAAWLLKALGAGMR